MKTGQLTIQNYKSYTKDDQKTWSSLYEGTLSDFSLGDEKLNKQFSEGLVKLKFKKGEIPNFENLNKLLKPLSGFEVIAVTGELENNIFFQLLRNRKFPVTVTLPNLFNEMFGCVPFLLNKSYGDELVAIAVNATANPSMYEEYRVQFKSTLLDSIKINETYATPAKID